MIEFTNLEALVFKKKYLVISDLHIGYEIELLRKGLNVPSNTQSLVNKIQFLKDKYNAKKLIICGDVKHNIPKVTMFEQKELVNFFEKISSEFHNVFLIKGNHDGKIEELISKRNIIVCNELKIGKVIFTHGHRKVKHDAKVYVIGHNHPVFPIRTAIGETFYEKVFVVGYFNNKSVVILPAFSDIVGGWEVGNFNGPIAKKIEKYQVFTVDGTLIYEYGF